MLVSQKMRRAPWPVVLVLGLMHAFVARAGDEVASCGLTRLASVHFMVIDGRLYLPVIAAGRSAWMMLDTGAAVNTIQKQYVHDFAQITHAQRPPLAVIELLQLGRAKIGSVDLAVVPEFRGVSIPPGGDPLIGVLAIDAFAHVDVELDFKALQLNLYSQDHCPGSVVYWASSYVSLPMQRDPTGAWYFPVELDGQKIKASLSTIWGSSVLYTDVSQHMFGFDEKSPNVEHKPANTGRGFVHFRAMSLTSNGRRVANADIVLSPNPLGERCPSFGKSADKEGAVGYLGCGSLVAPLRVGMQMLEQLHLYFAIGERVLYFTSVDVDGADASRVHVVRTPESN